MGSKQHLKRDPNDPRNVPNSDKLPLLTEVPEAEPTPVESFKVKDELSIQNVGWDPNDPRANSNPELESFPTGEAADAQE